MRCPIRSRNAAKAVCKRARRGEQFASLQHIVTSYSLGANSYVRKPVDFAEFTEAVKTIGSFWLVLSERPPQKPA